MVEDGNPHHYFVATQETLPKAFDEFFSRTSQAPEDHEASAESFCSIFFPLDPDHPLRHLHPE
uniref:UTP23 small subunit processome component n=1 Tax=Balaenoptera musculus TaxID=9771 RepID=A0A8C0D9F4_BALMU